MRTYNKRINKNTQQKHTTKTHNKNTQQKYITRKINEYRNKEVYIVL